MKSFTNLSKFKKHDYTKCVEGDCQNGESKLKVRFLDFKNSYGKFYHTILLTGMFKNGKLNGKASIYYYTSDFYSTAKTGVYKQRKIPNMRKTPFLEYIEAEFKDNIVYDGIYALKQENESFDTRKCGVKYSVLTNAYNFNLPPLVKYFKKYDYNYNKDQRIINFQYQGKFKSLNFLNLKNVLNNFKEIKINFIEGKYNFFNYTLTPNDENGIINLKSITNTGLISKTYRGTKLSTKIKIEDNECFGCDISEKSTHANNQTEYLANRKQKEKEDKISKAKSFVGHFIQGTYLAYVKSYNSGNGCISATRYPLKITKKGEYPQKFHDNCSHENYKIIPNARICPNCKGWGTKDVNVLHTTTYYTTDNAGNRTYDKSPSRSGYVSETHSCSVCKGKGVATN